ncbi:MAG: MBL fold metallo-hydrolase [Pseudomonadota bacterium]
MRTLVIAIGLLTIAACAGFMTREESTAVPGKPAHHRSDGRFVNTDGEAIDKPLSALLKWQREAPDVKRVSLPLAENDPAYLRANRTDSTLTWIGHSTFLLQHNGVNILTDPHFGQRASPVRFAGPKRLVPPGVDLDALPDIDIVVISHNHYDHLDRYTVKALTRKQAANPPTWFVPLKQKAWFESLGVPDVVELDWWQAADVGDWTVTAVPVKHWTSRTPFDRNTVLWAGWALQTDGFSFAHIGDSGYSADFKAIGDRLGPFDLAAVPIGAYLPRWFMQAAHMNPEEAVKVHRDLRAARSVAMHWGTFVLTDEPVEDPPRQLALALREAGVDPDAFLVLQHGETLPLAGGR